MTRVTTLITSLVMFGMTVGGTCFAEDRISFVEQVRPILSENCFHCHGPDAAKREADLRLDERDGAIDYGAIVPGKPAESILVERIMTSDPDLRMPPPTSNRSLSAEDRRILKQWIEEGAEYQSHWSFAPITSVEPPSVKSGDSVRHPIDQFVIAQLEKRGLSLSPPASKERWLRRVTFDLTGLPPTLEEIDAFLADDSPQAYEHVVDRLLASKRYGERMASEWLDVARYSDTYGYQVDRDRYVWPWRDWVIRAFNANMPYDEFITQQLAGDLLPDATDEQILATTFNRLHPQKVEGGSVPEEFRIEYVSDRTQTVATAFLGLTMECCRCHDHKYDPLSQREYYQLSAFFDNIDEAGLYSYFTSSVPTPTLVLADESTKQRLAKIEQTIAEAEAAAESVAASRATAFENWLNEAAGALSKEPADRLLPGQVAHLDFEQQSNGPNVSIPGPRGQALRLSGDDGVGLDVGNFKRYEPFSVALWVRTPDVKKRAVIYHRSRAWTDAASRGYELLIEDGQLSAALIHFYPGNAMRVRTRASLPIDEWVHVAVTYDGSSRADGLRIYMNGALADVDVVRDGLTKNITGGGGDNITIGERFRDRGFTNGGVDDFRVFERELTSLEVAHLHDDESLVATLAAPSASLDNNRRAQLFDYYLATRDDAYRAKLEELEQARVARSEATDNLAEIMVMRELPEPRPTYLLNRGAYDAPGEPVQPETPAALPPFPEEAPRNRLGLAQWLTSPEQPLTARVTVNRYWQMLFGQGLVRTPEDFGSQGQVPTHPQLLDWLAHDFVSHGWDVKRLLKSIVLSATYRQDSKVTPELLARDPENRWLSRSPSYRLSAEMLRDNALAVSGLLVEKIGGAPAKPYEVEVSFKPVKRDQGEGLYRRSLYTYWKRTGPAPVMMAFDASKRDVCRVKRERTSSPLQSLVLLNDPQVVEAARVLAAQLMQNEQTESERLTTLFRMLSTRQPTERETQIIEELFRRQKQVFVDAPERAQAYLQTGAFPVELKESQAQLAALAVVANTLFSFDECVMRR